MVSCESRQKNLGYARRDLGMCPNPSYVPLMPTISQKFDLNTYGDFRSYELE